MTPELFDNFKSFVAALEFSADTSVLDRRLGEVSNLLYAIRQEIDTEWLSAREANKHIRRRVQRAPQAPEFRMSDEEMEAVLTALKGIK